MFGLIRQVFIALLNFSRLLPSVADVSDQTKCLSLNDEPCMVWPTVINLNPVEIKYYPFMISFDKRNGSCNILSPKICVPKRKTQTLQHLIWQQLKMKLKQWQNIFRVVVNPNSIVQHATQTKNGIIQHLNVNIKMIVSSKKIIVWILAHVFTRIASIKKYWRYFSDCVWWNYNCYGYCINKNDKWYSNKCVNKV